jgi:hypothetical protein
LSAQPHSSTGALPTASALAPQVGATGPDRTTRVIIELLRSGQTVRFRARGSSMWPSITSRSEIEVRPHEAAELRVGQIAAFERRGRVVVHRVRAVAAEHVEFAGDALARADGPIERARVLGQAYVLRRRPLRLQLPRWKHARLVWRALRRRLAF